MQNLADLALLFSVHLPSNLVKMWQINMKLYSACYHSHHGGTALVVPEETLNNLDIFLSFCSTWNTHYE
jgi:hypothetical protein